MKKYPFSLTSMNTLPTTAKRHLVYSRLIWYINIVDSVVQHNESVSLIEVNAESLLECICNCFIRDDIPFENQISDLQLHEGEKRRAWKIVTKQSPQLFNIDGDACHHFHNTVKQFCKPFKCFDIQWKQSVVLIFWIRWKRFVLYWIYRLQNLRGSHCFPFLIAFPLIWLW